MQPGKADCSSPANAVPQDHKAADPQAADPQAADPATRAERASRAVGLIARRAGRGERVTLAEILGAVGGHGFTVLLLLLAAIAAVPSPGIPIGGPFGIVIMLIGVQMILGRHSLWLPGWITRRSVPRRKLGRAAVRAAALLRRLERWLRPRIRALSGDLARRFLGAISVILGFLLLLPIPFGNTPPALAMVIIALGLMARDGAAIAAGLASAAVALAYCGMWIAGAIVALGWLVA